MLKSFAKYFSIMILTALIGVGPALADKTPDEAKAMAEKAAAYVKEHGKEAAAAEFNKAQSDFIVDDLYVFVVDRQGVFLAHPIKPAMVGKNMMDMKDVEGTPLIKNFTEVKGEGWVPYKWPHPKTKQIQPKKSYIIDVDGFILGVGAYYTE